MKNKFSKMIVLVIIVLLLIAIILFSVFQSKKSQLNLTIDTSSEESMAVNFLRFGRFLQHGDDFFFSVYNPSLKKSGIYFYDKSENNYSKINDDNAFYLSVYDGFLYYVDVSQWMLTKISLDGQKKEEIVEAVSYIIDPKTGKIYFSKYPERSPLYCLNKQGEMTTIYDNFATNFIIDNDYLYFNNDDDFTIYRMDLNTLQSKQIVDVDVDKYIVKDDFIYYNNAELYRTNLNTLESEKLTEHNVDGFLINGDYLFYLAKDDAKNEKGKLVIADLDGNEITSISDDRIDVLNSYIYAVNNTLYISGTSRTDKILVLDLKTLNFDELDYNRIEY